MRQVVFQKKFLGGVNLGFWSKPVYLGFSQIINWFSLSFALYIGSGISCSHVNPQDIQQRAKTMSSIKSMFILFVLFCYIFRDSSGRALDQVGAKSKFILVCKVVKFYFCFFLSFHLSLFWKSITSKVPPSELLICLLYWSR